jgi:hypothetical protein
VTYTALAVLLILTCVALGASGRVGLGRSRPAFALAAATVVAQLALLLIAR